MTSAFGYRSVAVPLGRLPTKLDDPASSTTALSIQTRWRPACTGRRPPTRFGTGISSSTCASTSSSRSTTWSCREPVCAAVPRIARPADCRAGQMSDSRRRRTSVAGLSGNASVARRHNPRSKSSASPKTGRRWTCPFRSRNRRNRRQSPAANAHTIRSRRLRPLCDGTRGQRVTFGLRSATGRRARQRNSTLISAMCPLPASSSSNPTGASTFPGPWP